VSVAIIKPMDDARFGAALRAVRIRRGWRQSDLARAAGVSEATVSRVERGHLAETPLSRVRAIAAPLEIRVELLPRSRGGDVDRVVNARHAALSEAVIAWLGRFPGWVVRPEVSYSWFGERGVVDVIAWHAERTAMLEIELKTTIVDSGELLATMDRRRRLGDKIAAPIGWEPSSVSTLLIVAESTQNRRRVAALRSTLDAALPDRVAEVRRFLRDPDSALRGLVFFANRRPGQAIHAFATQHRVRPACARRRLAEMSSRAESGEEMPSNLPQAGPARPRAPVRAG